MHHNKLTAKKKRAEVPPQPPILPTVSRGGILELLLVQKKRGEELLKSDFLAIEDVRYWNLFTKEILSKAFGPQPEYIEAVIYAGEQKPYSAFEPESSLEKMRRRNFEIALKRLETCMKQLNPESSKTGPAGSEEPGDPEEAEDDSPEPPEEEEEEDEEEDENEEEDNEEEEMKLPPEKKEGKVETSTGARDSEKSCHRKVFILPGPDEEKKAELTKFLKNLGVEPVLLPEGPGEVNWMEKLGQESEVAFVLAVLCPDENARPRQDHPDAKRRLGQKMVFELGFLVGRLQRGRVCALYEEGLDLPSHHPAGVFLPWDAAGLWKLLVARAMKMANLEIDMNKAL